MPADVTTPPVFDIALEIPFFLSEERAETEKEKRKKFMKVFSKVDYLIF